MIERAERLRRLQELKENMNVRASERGESDDGVIRMIRDEFPDIQIILGLSNISFGLNAAARAVLNSVFLDHALKHGDSLVGLTREQIGAFHWSPPKRDWGPLFAGISASVDEATTWRRSIQNLGEGEYDRRRAAWRSHRGHRPSARE